MALPLSNHWMILGSSLRFGKQSSAEQERLMWNGSQNLGPQITKNYEMRGTGGKMDINMDAMMPEIVELNKDVR